jgi:hypothetical protein
VRQSLLHEIDQSVVMVWFQRTCIYPAVTLYRIYLFLTVQSSVLRNDKEISGSTGEK